MGPNEPLAMKPRICKHRIRPSYLSVSPKERLLFASLTGLCCRPQYLEMIRTSAVWELGQKDRDKSRKSPVCAGRLSAVLWRQQESDGLPAVCSHRARKYS